MKQQGFSVIWVIALVAVGLVGGFWWYTTQQVEDKGTDEATVETAEQVEPETTTIPNGWRLFSSLVMGIQFSYPEDWGDVVEAAFDDQDKTEHFGFSKLSSFNFGGHHVDYEFLPRGGSLVDLSGFRINEGGGYVYLDLDGNDTGAVDEGYSLSNNQNCLLNTDVDFFGGATYHAVCNTASESVPGFNFAVYDTGEVDEVTFIEVVNSVQLIW